MQTKITGFHQDTDGDWVAELACAHTQHVRHRPPWQLRPWTQSAEERAARIGWAIECPLCEMPELPAAAQRYKRTALFTERTIPAGLLRDHRTREGVWAKIVVESGALEYQLGERAYVLDSEHPAVVEPTVPHRVQPIGPVRFVVELYRTDA